MRRQRSSRWCLPLAGATPQVWQVPESGSGGAEPGCGAAPRPAASPFADADLQAGGAMRADYRVMPGCQGDAHAAGAAQALPRSPFQVAQAGGAALRSPFAGAVQGVAGPAAARPRPARDRALQPAWGAGAPRERAALQRLGSRNMSCEYGGGGGGRWGGGSPSQAAWAPMQAGSAGHDESGPSLGGSRGSGPCDMDTLSSTVRQLSMSGSGCDLLRGG
jgi:hypothetical protein